MNTPGLLDEAILEWIKLIVTFLLGGGAGAAITSTVMKKKYKNRASSSVGGDNYGKANPVGGDYTDNSHTQIGGYSNSQQGDGNVNQQGSGNTQMVYGKGKK